MIEEINSSPGLWAASWRKTNNLCEHLLKDQFPAFLDRVTCNVSHCDILRYQRLERLCSGFLWSGFVICCPSAWRTAEWLAALRSSASQLFGPGLLHNYIKAWSTAQPQHTSYKYDDTSSLHSSPLCTLFSSSYPCCYANMLEEALGPSPLMTCVTAPSVTRYIKMHVGVGGFERCCTIYTEGWSVARFSLFP